MKNQIEIKFKSLPENEAFARTCVSAFCLQLNPTLDEIGDITARNQINNPTMPTVEGHSRNLGI